jgi:hypothetical protein
VELKYLRKWDLGSISYSGGDVRYSRQFWSETIRYGLDMLIEGFVDVYDSVVEWNERITIFSIDLIV